MPSFAVILPAAGSSSRFGGREKKVFAGLDGRPVWLRSVEVFVTRPDVCQCLLVISPADRELFRTRYAANVAFMDVRLVDGGATRADSVANALAQLKPEAEFVAVHDAARPCLNPALIDQVFARADACGAAVPAVPVADTVKRADPRGVVTETLPREGLWLAQTPQAFRRDWLVGAYARRAELGPAVTDDAQLVTAAGHPVLIVPGSPTNIKITTPADLRLAEAILKSEPKPKAQGPAHPFAEEREMWK
jgi:2-C-methyl-D-erythritol 4-phosphate cytidylyltransferase